MNDEEKRIRRNKLLHRSYDIINEIAFLEIEKRELQKEIEGLNR